MMEKVKQRIMHLEREVQQDENRQKEKDDRAANRQHMEGHYEVLFCNEISIWYAHSLCACLLDMNRMKTTKKTRKMRSKRQP